ncbi:MAG: uracil-DNA glycosylase [Sedimentisphaerales bacterium]|nr:uracil-DNA glycosylase [Sedimentisphaerales bacterium]
MLSPRQRILHTLREQLAVELFLGGRWLPIGRWQPQAAGSPGAPRRKVPVMTTRPNRRAAAAKQKRLDELADKVRGCARCELHSTRTHAVAGQGNPDARLVFVGEAPGADEDAQGLAFVGRAGQLLTKIIQAMGLRREDVFIGNILKCRPPGNRDPQVSEIDACIDYLCRQLEIIEPEVIVALGAYAARTLLESTEAIGRLRARVHEYYPTPLGKSIKLVATYHPAYLLRNYTPDARRRVWDDMKLVLQELQLPVGRPRS